MGLWDKVLDNISGRDYNVNDALAKTYGQREVAQTYKEISKKLKPIKKEDNTINDQILEIYSNQNKEDIQNDLMKKYLKISRDDLNQQEIAKKQLEHEEMKKEIDSTLEGQDKKTKDEVYEELIEEENNEPKKEGEKDKKKELQSRIYKATYKSMYKDYASLALKMKNSQFGAMDVAISSKEAMQMIAMERNLDRIELRYNRTTGKDFSMDKNIKNQREDFKNKFEYVEKGVEATTNRRSIEINRLYKVREAKHREYVDAMMDKSKTPQKIAMYKQAYDKANYDLIQNMPSLNEYTQELEVQSENERLAKDAGLENKSAVNSRIDNKNLDDSKNNSQKVTDSKMAEIIDEVKRDEQVRDERNFDYTIQAQRSQIDKGNYKAAKEIGDSQTSRRIYDENIEQTPKQSTYSETKKDAEKTQERNDDMFFDQLRSGVQNMDEIDEEDIERIQNIAKDEIEKKANEELLEQKKEQQEYQIERKPKKTSGNN